MKNTGDLSEGLSAQVAGNLSHSVCEGLEDVEEKMPELWCDRAQCTDKISVLGFWTGRAMCVGFNIFHKVSVS